MKVWINSSKPFHVVHIKHNDRHIGYDIYLANHHFLKSTRTGKDFQLKRHEAYAICRLLNKERRAYKWADKFEDPYK